MKKKANRVAVVTARMPCMMAMPSEGCAGAMALSTVGSECIPLADLRADVVPGTHPIFSERGVRTARGGVGGRAERPGLINIHS
eukprot:520898-Pleurochrysis_carterae.AAC.1